MTAEDERELMMRTVAALSAFGGPAKVAVAGEGEREIEVRAARVDADDHHSLTLVEMPADVERGRGGRVDAYLAPNSDLEEIDGEPRKLREPMKLYSIAEKPAPDYIAVIPHVDAGAWLARVLQVLHRALKPVVDAIERKRLN